MGEARCRTQLEYHSPGIRHSCSFAHQVVLAVAMEEPHHFVPGQSHTRHTSRCLCLDFVQPMGARRSHYHAGRNRHDPDGLAAMERELLLVDEPTVGSHLLERRSRPDRTRQSQLQSGRQGHHLTDYQRVLA